MRQFIWGNKRQCSQAFSGKQGVGAKRLRNVTSYKAHLRFSQKL